MNRYRLVHVTHFSYDALITDSYNEVRLRPMQDELQSCLSFRLTTAPAAPSSMHLDFYGNAVHRFNVLTEHRRLRVEADSIVLVQMPRSLPADGLLLNDLPGMQDELDEQYDYMNPTEYVPFEPGIRALAEHAAASAGGHCGAFALSAMEVVHRSFRYEKGATHVRSSIRDTLGAGAGVCQDFAHILLGVLRSWGLPARYVSGYLVPRRTAEPGASVEEVVGGHASHAWTEVFIPGAGWFGLDPTLGQPVGLQHVRVAYGRDYGDVAPIRGVYKGHAGQHMSVDVRVRPALDDEGNDLLEETAAAPPTPPEGPSQQPQQQQQ
jgi:transglutaminase-like putative cysteine protease